MGRIKELDFIKGILILCVMYGHICSYITPSSLSSEAVYAPTVFMRMFQMPLFVMISGYFGKKVTGIQDYMNVWGRYLKRLLLPFFVWCLLLVICKIVFLGGGSFSPLDLVKAFGILWFIPMLLISHFIFTSYSLLCGRRFNNVLAFVLLVCVIIASMVIPGDAYNFLFLFPFYLIGYLIKSFDFKKLLVERKFLLPFLSMLSVAICLFFPEDKTFYHVLNSSDLGLFFVMLRYICYGIVSLTVLLLCVRISDRIQNKITDTVTSIGMDMTFFFYLSHITVLYYTLRVAVIRHSTLLPDFFDNPFIRYYVIATALLFLIVFLLFILYRIISRNRFLSTLLLGR